MQPICHLATLAPLFWLTGTPACETAISVLGIITADYALHPRLFARERNKSRRVKTKASVREKELESRNSRKHQPVYVVLQKLRLNAVAGNSEPKR
jgi:hypothetical protein